MTSRTRRAASAGSNQPPAENRQEDHDMAEASQDTNQAATEQETTNTQDVPQPSGATQQQQTPVSEPQPPVQHPQVDTILVQLNERVEQTARDLLQAQGKSQAEHEEAMRHHRQAQEARSAYQHTLIHGHSRKEDQIVPANMPMLQIKGGPMRDASKTIHESVQAFCSAFEAQLRSRSLDLNRHWERLIWTTLDSQQIQWATQRLAGRDYTWEQAQVEIQRMYGNPLYIYRKQFELSRKFQRPGQSLKLHTEEWQELAYEANCEPSPQTTFNYVNSLLKPVRETIWPILSTKFELNLPSSINEVAQLAIGAMGEYMEDGYEQVTPIARKRQHMGNQDGTFKRRQYGNCPVHPKGSHAANDCLVLRQLNQGRQQTSQHAPIKDKGPRLCRYCKKAPYQPGHKCSEYYQQRKVVHNRSINVNQTSSSRDQAILDHLLPVNLEKMDITGTHI
ncbi:hypothetical protein O0I10_011542 [Lichtheimia ornata]|uniref:Retrotransposon gag domain-containing protein n=1 Tax=Lichtheimia ornata TaxID=688661 RepID=A0AAD7USN7_9FUNG|nr:uncharacterized protein O0I10_011542 [Lichtheimia ornata]KAJ8652803.1 hypothetical protein O0I10_011542 [Lichtheimia ornata]